ncbi:hypothetical protein, partial [Streptococcus pneumoniae]|uniref:hypothetical protein n=1 Tax=Streptococcus pneumoniae TaxID=1313 RepID=UPI0018B0982A
DGTITLDLDEYRVTVESVAEGAIDAISIQTETLAVSGTSALGAASATSLAVSGDASVGPLTAGNTAITGTASVNSRPILTEKDFGRVIELT